jgi:hypothetical protein
MRKWYGYVFSKESSPVKKSISTCPRSSQVVNGSRIGKCNNYYQFIMKAEGMKNHDVHIMHALQTLSPVFYTGMCHGKSAIRFKTSRHHEFTVLQHDSSFCPTRYKFQMLGTHFSRETRPALCLQFPLPVQVDQSSLPVHLSDTPRAEYILVAPWRPPKA